MNDTSINVGDKVRFEFTHLFQTVTCVAVVARVRDETVSLRFSDRVTSLPFPPCQKGTLLIVDRRKAAAAKVR